MYCGVVVLHVARYRDVRFCVVLCVKEVMGLVGVWC
jgi:hypothetical protein